MDAAVTEDEDIERIAHTVRTIAMVGLSPNEARPAWGVGRYLQSQGYRGIPVNPGHAGKSILGEVDFDDLAQIPTEAGVQMVDIFRRSEAVPQIVDEALASLPALKVIWTQLGVTSESAAQKARAQGLTVIQDRCPKIEFPRFL